MIRILTWQDYCPVRWTGIVVSDSCWTINSTSSTKGRGMTWTRQKWQCSHVPVLFECTSVVMEIVPVATNEELCAKTWYLWCRSFWENQWWSLASPICTLEACISKSLFTRLRLTFYIQYFVDRKFSSNSIE